MRLRRVATAKAPTTQISTARGWVNVPDLLGRSPGLRDLLPETDLLGLLSAPLAVREGLQQAAESSPPSTEPARPLLPFRPASYRDFMLYEAHVIGAARGYARRFLPGASRLARLAEQVSGRPFPAFKPKPLWYRQPIYYMGNHLTFIGEGETVPWPEYCTLLDYELELGLVLSRPLLNAAPQEAEAAIGGFVIFNDISARNVQRGEMTSDFGPQKAKHFCNVMGAEVVSADKILPRWQTLTGEVRINHRTVAHVWARGPQFTLGEALAHVSQGEQLHPGEFFGTGTLPGGSGLENGHVLSHGDTVTLELHGVGSVSNPVAPA